MSIGQDLRYAVRQLAKSPGTTGVAVLALALGIGANAGMLPYAAGIVLRPFPFPESDKIVALESIDLTQGTGSSLVSSADFFAWQDESASFERMAALAGTGGALGGVDEREQLRGNAVSRGFFPLLRVKPALGRAFLPAEFEPGYDGVIILAHGLWVRRFEGSASALGRVVQLDDRTYTIVGVMPRDFEFPLGAEYWAPLVMDARHSTWTKQRRWTVLARLKPGVSVAQASVEMGFIAARLAEDHPSTNEGLSARVLRLAETGLGSRVRRWVVIMLAAAAFVLALACVNVSNLLLARATTRRHEMAVRSALGAGRLRIARLFVAEALLLSLLGGAAGVLLGAWSLSFGRATTPALVYRLVPGLGSARIDGTVLLAVTGLAILSGLGCGLFAAWRASRASALAAALADEGRGPIGGRVDLRRLLVVAEVALALVLLVGAGVMVRSYAEIVRFDSGLDPTNVLQMRVTLPGGRYGDSESIRRYSDDVVNRLEGIPGVTAAGARAGVAVTDFRFVGQPPPPAGTRMPELQLVTSGFHEVVRLPLLKGRRFRQEDEIDGAAPVAIVSETVVRQFWKTGSDPIGATVVVPDHGLPPFRVVGVAGDVTDWYFREPLPTVYVLNAQMPQRSLQILARTRDDPMALAGRVRAEVQAVDPSQPIEHFRTMERDLWEQKSGLRMAATWMGAMGVVALLLATTGIYGVVAFSVARRRREMGVRMALGARPADVLRTVVGQSMRTTAVGMVVGGLAAFLLMQGMSRLLDGVVPLDATVFLGMGVVLMMSAALAAYLPARRAARIDPLVALRHE